MERNPGSSPHPGFRPLACIRATTDLMKEVKEGVKSCLLLFPLGKIKGKKQDLTLFLSLLSGKPLASARLDFFYVQGGCLAAIYPFLNFAP